MGKIFKRIKTLTKSLLSFYFQQLVSIKSMLRQNHIFSECNTNQTLFYVPSVTKNAWAIENQFDGGSKTPARKKIKKRKSSDNFQLYCEDFLRFSGLQLGGEMMNITSAVHNKHEPHSWQKAINSNAFDFNSLYQWLRHHNCNQFCKNKNVDEIIFLHSGHG